MLVPYFAPKENMITISCRDLIYYLWGQTSIGQLIVSHWHNPGSMDLFYFPSFKLSSFILKSCMVGKEKAWKLKKKTELLEVTIWLKKRSKGYESMYIILFWYYE